MKELKYTERKKKCNMCERDKWVLVPLAPTDFILFNISSVKMLVVESNKKQYNIGFSHNEK